MIETKSKQPRKALTGEQMEEVAALYAKIHKTHTVEECIEIYLEKHEGQHSNVNIYKLSAYRVDVLKKGGTYVEKER